ncbi:MAG TPA: hypothetical protein IAC36_01435 [Candidatus Aphodomonas merdavium]|nr:hypothetical protein [Candidatus Aphodomonas merdavium]
MRYHLDTIPVWDAFRTESECPLCDLKQNAEATYAQNFLGGSVMESDVRLEVNQKGFCARHFAQMLSLNNRLGLALITHTHMQQATGKRQAPAPRAGLFSRRSVPAQEAESCILCDRLNATMDRYLYTVLHLFGTDESFRETFSASKGFCMPHARALANMAAQTLPQKKAQAFSDALDALQKANLERVEQELFWFTQKFDFRNADKPWGNSKDAPERAILKLRGRF